MEDESLLNFLMYSGNGLKLKGPNNTNSKLKGKGLAYFPLQRGERSAGRLFWKHQPQFPLKVGAAVF